MTRNIVIADPGLLSVIGHHFHVSTKYAAAAAELGLNVKILAHKDFVAETPEERIVHAFTHNPYDPPRWLRQETPRTLIGPNISALAKDLLRVGPFLPLT